VPLYVPAPQFVHDDAFRPDQVPAGQSFCVDVKVPPSQ
jgi:hypothetical protein